MIDLHMHILPGLDDGPSNMAESLEMCRLAEKDGAQAVVATPHMLDGVYEVSRNEILKGVENLQHHIRESGLSLKIFPGAEIHIHQDLVRFLNERKLVTLGDGGRYILLEFPRDIVPPGFDHYLFSLQLAGIIPIITHPERNIDIQSDPGMLIKSVTSGTLLQITAGSLTGEFGLKPYKCSRKLLEMGMVHLVASDAHSATNRPPGLEKAFTVIKQALNMQEAEEIFNRRPTNILENKTIDFPEIRTNTRVGFLKKLCIWE